MAGVNKIVYEIEINEGIRGGIWYANKAGNRYYAEKVWRDDFGLDTEMMQVYKVTDYLFIYLQHATVKSQMSVDINTNPSHLQDLIPDKYKAVSLLLD